MINWIQELFAELHQHVFESGVLPVLYALELGGEAERAFNATQFFLIGAIEITFLAIVLGALEKWRPVEEQPHTDWKKTDALYTMLHRLGFVPLLLFFLLMPLVDTLDGALRMHDIIPPNLEDLVPWLAGAPLVSFLIYLVVLDFVAYWLHRWQHRYNWWWSLHSLHHSQREMSFWSDDRNHLLDDLLIDSAHVMVALLIGVPPGQFITLVVASRMIESLSHANLRVHFGNIGERLLVSPRFHRVHHAVGLGHEGSTQGCNFAVLFPIWDVLFGTANFERTFPATGVRDQADGRDYGDTFWRQQWLGLQRLLVRQ
ncbi:MAG: sterol desaturase family protein [Rhodocyclaceae bacterium]|nr:sterol desaturase family protein [Rhodocyclaceae bacterium]MCA3023475.1 sterol desaturase family protein [Rhodocyclaceae bacterium]MCA3028629.1 sterol desaturase family protein [Rhodocyclaceae bacterium]MCA3052987.1 sterol desaturase family protein [Rhodocyclaceae bacterium]MCE2724326.1 sterol desaturase family protein [Betaproteobacteria bacterium]